MLKKQGSEAILFGQCPRLLVLEEVSVKKAGFLEDEESGSALKIVSSQDIADIHINNLTVSKCKGSAL